MIAHRLSVRDLKAKLDAGQALLILDVRQGFSDSDRMIPGALHVDARDLNPKLFNMSHDVELVVYDNKRQEDDAMRVADALQAAGFCARALQGGWDEWLKAGFPTEARQERSIREHTGNLQAQQEEGGAKEAAGAMEEARQRLEDRAEGVTHAVGDLASRALHLVQSLIRR